MEVWHRDAARGSARPRETPQLESAGHQREAPKSGIPAPQLNRALSTVRWVLRGSEEHKRVLWMSCSLRIRVPSASAMLCRFPEMKREASISLWTPLQSLQMYCHCCLRLIDHSARPR